MRFCVRRTHHWPVAGLDATRQDESLSEERDEHARPARPVGAVHCAHSRRRASHMLWGDGSMTAGCTTTHAPPTLACPSQQTEPLSALAHRSTESGGAHQHSVLPYELVSGAPFIALRLRFARSVCQSGAGAPCPATQCLCLPQHRGPCPVPWAAAEPGAGGCREAMHRIVRMSSCGAGESRAQALPPRPRLLLH